MTRWLARLGVASALVVFALWYGPRPSVPLAEAQGVGIFSRATCTTLNNPEPGKTFCFDQGTNTLRVWTGAAWQLVTLATKTEASAIGGAPSNDTLFRLTGAFTPSDAFSYQLRDDATTLVPAGRGAYGLTVTPTFTRAGSGTHATLATAQLGAPTINGPTTTVTNAATLFIDSSPSGATNNYAAWLAGPLRFDALSATTNYTFGGTTAIATANLNNYVYLRGSFTGTTSGTSGFYLDAALTGVENGDIYGLASIPGFVRASSGTHTHLIGTYAGTPIDLGGAAAATNITTLYVQGVATWGTTNRAAWIAGGGLAVGSSATDMGTGTVNAASATYANGIPVIVAAGASPNLVNIRGISASSTLSNNLRGSCNFAAANTCQVTFGLAESDAHYFVITSGLVNVSAKAKTGFLLTATTNNSNVVDYLIVR